MSNRIALVACALVPLVVSACRSDDVVKDERRATTSAIVNGTPSTASQDATVLVANDEGSCTGTLIAPNLVLTARHCVAEPNQGAEECVGYGPTNTPSAMKIFLGVDARSDGNPDAVGSKITVPQTSNICGFDVALIQLDRELTGAKTAAVRFTELAPNEKVVAVGYGVDGQDQELPARMQRSTTVIGVGPKSINFAAQDGQTFPFDLPKGDVATGESTCYGDSGGPLYDAQGRVVALTSRGIAGPEAGQAHGNGCVDLPSIYAGARFNESLIRQAAKDAGHPLPQESPAPKIEDPKGGGADPDATTGTATPKKTSPQEDSEPETTNKSKDKSGKKTSSGDDDAPAKGTSDKKKTGSGATATKNGALPPANPMLGCSAAPGRGAGSRPSAPPTLAVALFALAIGFARRRLQRRS